MRVFCELEVETGIIDEYQGIRAILAQQALGFAEIAHERRKLAEHLAESHHVHLPVMQIGIDTRLTRHQVSAEIADIKLGIVLTKIFYKLGGVQVARRLTGYHDIFHGRESLDASILSEPTAYNNMQN